MIGAAALAALGQRKNASANGDALDNLSDDSNGVLPTLQSPFSLTAAFKFGVIFLALDIAGTLAQRVLGETGFYAVSAVGGLVSSASAVASAANLASSATIAPQIAGNGAVIASAMSALVNLPLVARLAKDNVLTLKTAGVLGMIVLLGVLGCVIQAL
jgi:uncharacterized membrane protein (DUF4010 family)